MNKKLRTVPFLPFYCFNQTFRCVDELSKEFEAIAVNVCDFFEEVKEKNWLEFWQVQGNDIVLELWKNKYKEYISNSTEQINSSEILADERATKSDDLILKERNIEDNTLSWQTLWDEHITEVYVDQYKNFEDIYNHYFWVLKQALSNENNRRKSENEYSNDIKSELEELQLAGLPTAFGSKQQPKRQSIKAKKQEYVLAKSDFDENDDTDNREEDIYFSATDTSDTELEMPPIEINRSNESYEQIGDGPHKTKKQSVRKSKKNRMLRLAPAFMQEEKAMQKYWRQRFSLFSRFDEGIQLDRESWFSVTPEKVAKHIAQRIMRDVAGSGNGLTIIDGFCGCGGNTIQFAMTCNKVIAIDIDAKKIEMAKHNANIYGVADKVEFIVGDFLQIAQMGTLKADAVFLSPPWGGPEYKSVKTYNIETCLEPVSASELMRITRCITNNIALFLPRNSNMTQIIRLAGVGNKCEVEHNFLDTRIVGLTAFYGGCIAKQKN